MHDIKRQFQDAQHVAHHDLNHGQRMHQLVGRDLIKEQVVAGTGMFQPDHGRHHVGDTFRLELQVLRAGSRILQIVVLGLMHEFVQQGEQPVAAVLPRIDHNLARSRQTHYTVRQIGRFLDPNPLRPDLGDT